MAEPGLHSNFDFGYFSPEETKIIDIFARDWFVTSSTRPIEVSRTSIYRAFLIKPTDYHKEAFGLDREIIVLFSSYEEFHARTIDAFEPAAKRWEGLRVDPVCKILISKDVEIVRKINDLIKLDPETPIIVPYFYGEFSNRDFSFIRQRLSENFYYRNLFAFQSPLKKELYFFGRSRLLQSLIQRHRSGENSALFGLRRSGKTSIIFGLERASKNADNIVFTIDCQSPSAHNRRWNDLLHYIVVGLAQKFNAKSRLVSAENYNEINAADAFTSDIRSIFNAIKKKTILLVFDEIERISPRVGAAEHWSSGRDFLLFWRSIRSAFQGLNGIFSFLLVGTNTFSVEMSMINGEDNPLFNTVISDYIPGFPLDDVREMVRKLGSYMGMRFDDLVFAKLYEDFGGHPFLIRHVCSLIYDGAPQRRPYIVDKQIYERAKKNFNSKNASYTEMILEGIRRDFPDEYEMLSYLALEDLDHFNEFLSYADIIRHVIGYGIIAQSDNSYYFKIEAIKDHIKLMHKYNKQNVSQDDIAMEVAERRRKTERGLRNLVRTVFIINHKNDGVSRIISSVARLATKIGSCRGLNQILSSESKILLLSDLTDIISANFILFSELFDNDIVKFTYHSDVLRRYRNEEAHSRTIGKPEFIELRKTFEYFENVISDFLI